MSKSIQCIVNPVRHGLILAIAALIFGALWAAFLAVNHESLHNSFEKQEQGQHVQDMDMSHLHANGDTHGHEQTTTSPHTHSGSLANDAMQRLLRGHIHFMGLGVLSAVLLLITAFTRLKRTLKKILGWTLGIATLAYPPAWILMGFRTVELGPQAAEASVMWLFGPAIGLLLASMTAILGILIIEMSKSLQNIALLSNLFERNTD